MAFARAERSSYYDLIAAARLCSDPARRALYLRHASDESRHALMFTLRAEQLAADVAADPHEQHADFEHLFERLGEERFLAFVYAGERRGRAQLSMYRDELARRGDDKSRALLDAVLVDEARHEQYTREQLTQLVGEPAVPTALRRARGWELARGWLRAGRAVSSLLFGAGMRVLYLSLFPLALVVRARTPRSVDRR
jgi:rubrerythrin